MKTTLLAGLLLLISLPAVATPLSQSSKQELRPAGVNTCISTITTIRNEEYGKELTDAQVNQTCTCATDRFLNLVTLEDEQKYKVTSDKSVLVKKLQTAQSFCIRQTLSQSFSEKCFSTLRQQNQFSGLDDLKVRNYCSCIGQNTFKIVAVEIETSAARLKEQNNIAQHYCTEKFINTHEGRSAKPQ